MSLFGLFKSKAQKQAEMDIANARFKLQNVDSGIKVSGAEDLLAQAEYAFENKNWKDASILANKCVVSIQFAEKLSYSKPWGYNIGDWVGK
ncbi:MAG TPA: hypothetical protein EYP22_10975 [Methanosarcinales archaeon]|nr:hypothetical protein [Methanosarcinales archaeon]